MSRIDVSKFAGREDLFTYLVTNKSRIIDAKKSSFIPLLNVNKCSDPFFLTEDISKDEVIGKALTTSNTDDLVNGVIKRTIIGNTYNWMDSHDDVHIDGIFAKTIAERAKKIAHCHDHIYTINGEVGKFESIYEQKVQWKNLGVSAFGYTTCLMADSIIEKEMNPQVFKSYLNNSIYNHSVGMWYVKLTLAVNDPQYKEEYAEWSQYIPNIGNRPDVEKQGFFFAIKEAGLREISGLIGDGSNPLTQTLENIQPVAATTGKTKPEEHSTSEDEKRQQANKSFIYF